MNNILKDVKIIDDVIRQLTKIDSKMQVGQFIGADRDVKRLISFFEQHKVNIIAGEEINKITLTDPNKEK